MKKKVLSALTIVGIVVFTGCANLGIGGSGDLLSTLTGVGQFADKVYQSYQAGVNAGHLPPSAEVSDKYAQYLFLFNLASSWLKPNAPPPQELIVAKDDLVKSINEAKADAAKAKKTTKKPSLSPAADLYPLRPTP